MASILTNSSALTALRNLSNTQSALGKTQNQISTGLKVAEAADNTTNWSVSTQMKTDNSVLSTIKASMSQSAETLNTANGALGELTKALEEMKVELAKAKNVIGGDYEAINTSLAAIGKRIEGIVDGAENNGVNLLNGTVTGPVSLVSGWSGGTTGSGFKTIDVAITDMDAALVSGAGAVNALSITAATDVDTHADTVETALKAVRDYAVELGAAKNQITAQQTFLGVLSESLTNTVSTLVDADMNEASTRLQALQTQQQLGVQSLSIANQNSQMILKLFG
ncbi:MAG TPA: flagellin [Microvirga sp.]|nr:flagellin [Microvirga sp.]